MCTNDEYEPHFIQILLDTLELNADFIFIRGIRFIVIIKGLIQ